MLAILASFATSEVKPAIAPPSALASSVQLLSREVASRIARVLKANRFCLFLSSMLYRGQLWSELPIEMSF